MPFITPSTSAAYEAAYKELYAKAPSDVKALINKAKEDNNFTCREVEQFIKDVCRKAEYVPNEEEMAEIRKLEKLEAKQQKQPPAKQS